MRWLTLLWICVPAWAQVDFPAEIPLRPAAQATIVHDVRDLMSVLQAAPAPRRQVFAFRFEGEKPVPQPIGRDGVALPGAAPADAPGDEAGAQRAVTTLIELLHAFAPKELRPELQGKGGMLFGSLSPEQMEWLKRTLDHQREGLTKKLAFELRLLTLPANGLAELRAGGPPVVLPTAAQRDALLARSTAAGGAVTTLPPFVTAPLAPAATAALNKIAYIRDYELCVNVQPGGQTIADPQIDHALDGVEATANALLLPDGVVGVLLRLQDHDLQKPIATAKSKLGDMDIEIALPHVRRTSLRATLQLEAGQTVAFVPPENGGRTRAVMVTLMGVEGAK